MSIHIEQVSHAFGATRVLRQVDLHIAEGEIVCLLGPSGCGKTTLLRLIAGLERLQSGRIAIAGEEVASPVRVTPPERRRAGLVFQDVVLFPHLTVMNNVLFGVEKGSARKERAQQQLAAVEMEGFADRFPHELSGGQQQRVALARALARDPNVMLLDEPFASIDVVLRRRLRENLRHTLKARAMTSLLVTHDPEEALDVGDRIAVMRDGVFAEIASPRDLYETPQTPEGASLFPGAQTLSVIHREGWVETAFGPLDTLEKNVDLVVVHHGGARAVVDHEGLGRVIDVRYRGPDWSVHVEAISNPAHRLRAMSEASLDVGDRVRVDFDPVDVRFFTSTKR